MVDFDYLRDVSQTTSFLDVLDYYNIDYHNSGTDRYKILCPFHDDHSPSLIIYTNSSHDSESFCCYVDNTAGDIFHFIRQMEGGDFQKAWSILCHINGIEDVEADPIDRVASLLKVKSDDPRPANNINAELSSLYRRIYYSMRAKLSEEELLEFTRKLDGNLKELDAFLDTRPPYVDLQRYRKIELEKMKVLQRLK
jgi:DNA primase